MAKGHVPTALGAHGALRPFPSPPRGHESPTVPGEAGALQKGTVGRGPPMFTHGELQIPPLASQPPSPSAAPLRFEVTSCLLRLAVTLARGALGAGRETAEAA